MFKVFKDLIPAIGILLFMFIAPTVWMGGIKMALHLFPITTVNNCTTKQ